MKRESKFTKRRGKLGRGVGEKERDTELEQQHNYGQQKQSFPMDDSTMCMVVCTAHCAVDLRGRKRRKKSKTVGVTGVHWSKTRGYSVSVVVCSYQVDILFKGLDMYNRCGSVFEHRRP